MSRSHDHVRTTRTPLISAELVHELRNQPWRHGFLAIMRRIAATPGIDPVGTAQRPSSEPFRLGQAPSLAFASREIDHAHDDDGRLHLRLLSLGTLGPNGPLPIHVTEIARDRAENRRDRTLVNFLDLFHHRFLSLFYRAWAMAQSTAGLDRPDTEPFSFYLATLAGHDPVEIRNAPLQPHARMSAFAHLIRESRNPDGLYATLSDYFDVQVGIEEHVFAWIAIDPTNQCRLATPGPACAMGRGALLGECAPDRQHTFRVIVGPMDMRRYLRFAPQGEDLPRLIEWVRAFIGYEYDWELELRLAAQDVEPAILSGPHRLGWSSWLGAPESVTTRVSIRFRPEAYRAASVCETPADIEPGTARDRCADFMSNIAMPAPGERTSDTVGYS